MAPADPPTHPVAAGDVIGRIATLDASNANLDPGIIALEEDTYTLTTVDTTG